MRVASAEDAGDCTTASRTRRDPVRNESVYHASDEGHDACLQILERFADKKKLAVEASKCLATQMHWGIFRVATWLLDHGADPNYPYPQTGDTSLHSAVINNARDATLELLLHHGTSIECKNNDGKTPLQLARSLKKPNERIVSRLHTSQT